MAHGGLGGPNGHSVQNHVIAETEQKYDIVNPVYQQKVVREESLCWKLATHINVEVSATHLNVEVSATHLNV